MYLYQRECRSASTRAARESRASAQAALQPHPPQSTANDGSTPVNASLPPAPKLRWRFVTATSPLDQPRSATKKSPEELEPPRNDRLTPEKLLPPHRSFSRTIDHILEVTAPRQSRISPRRCVAKHNAGRQRPVVPLPPALLSSVATHDGAPDPTTPHACRPLEAKSLHEELLVMGNPALVFEHERSRVRAAVTKNLLADDFALCSDAKYPIESLPFLSTREGSPATHEGGESSNVKDLGASLSSSTKGISSQQVSPTRRTGRVIMLDDAIGGLLFDEDLVTVLRFHRADLILHSMQMRIGDIFSYNRQREAEGGDKAVRMLRQQTGAVEADVTNNGVSHLEESPQKKTFVHSAAKRKSLIGLEYRAILHKGDGPSSTLPSPQRPQLCITDNNGQSSLEPYKTNDTANKSSESPLSPQRKRKVVQSLVTEHQVINGKVLLRLCAEGLLEEAIDEELNYLQEKNEAQKASKGSADGKKTYRSIFSGQASRAPIEALEEFESRGKASKEALAKKKNRNYGKQWFMNVEEWDVEGNAERKRQAHEQEEELRLQRRILMGRTLGDAHNQKKVDDDESWTMLHAEDSDPLLGGGTTGGDPFQFSTHFPFSTAAMSNDPTPTLGGRRSSKVAVIATGRRFEADRRRISSFNTRVFADYVNLESSPSQSK